MERIVYFTIGNNRRPARVTAIDHPHHQLYHVVFEDGYENIFFTDVETGEWLEEDLGKTALANAFGRKLVQLQRAGGIARPRKLLSWCRATIADTIVNFGFCTHIENTHTVFEVYTCNHKFLCNLVKNSKGRWIMYGAQRPSMEYQYTNQLHIIISLFEGMADSNAQAQ